MTTQTIGRSQRAKSSLGPVRSGRNHRSGSRCERPLQGARRVELARSNRQNCKRASSTGSLCNYFRCECRERLLADRVKQSLTSAGFEPALLTIPPGEKSKSLAQAGEICDRMAAAGLDRSSFVVALGGGVVGDLAGFVAAIYHRGIPYVQVPTTLLAQVDSSIGGKTAVNTAAGKNLIGAVHHPVLVISDVDLLRTLPPREFNQGFAEIIKHAIIKDRALFRLLEVARLSTASGTRRGEFPPGSCRQRNVKIKAKFVAADARDESGTRALLNFGHTVGHAIEQAGDYRDLLHGEAVSLGIVAACDISVRKAGLPDSQRTKIVSCSSNIICRHDCLRIFRAKRFCARFPSIRNSKADRCDLWLHQKLAPRA